MGPDSVYLLDMRGSVRSCPVLIGFEYGAKPTDWSFEWDLEVEEIAGEFWQAVENPVLQVPGAWVEED